MNGTFFQLLFKKNLQWKDIKNTNEKGVLLICMLNIKVAASKRTSIRFLQMPVFAELSFYFRQARFLVPRGELCSHSSKT